MNLLRVSSLLCICLVIVTAEVEHELLAESSGGKHRRRTRGHAKNRDRAGMKLRIGDNISYITSYNVSTSVKCTTCNTGVCNRYGSSGSLRKPLCRDPDKRRCCPKVPVPVPDWKEVTMHKAYILRRGNLMIVCVASDIEECYGKHGHDNWDIENDVPDMKGVFWSAVIDGVEVFCKESEMEDCPVIEGSNHTEWKPYCNGTDADECIKDSQWEQIVDEITIICVANEVEDCMKMRSGHWVSSARGKNYNGKPRDALWVMDGEGVEIYCTADEVKNCPILEKEGRNWKKVPEDEQDYSGTPSSEWQQKVGEVTIICIADYIEDCEKVRHGHWVPSDRHIDEKGVPEDSYWVIDNDIVKIYCDAKEASSCPKLSKGGTKWNNESNESYDPRAPGNMRGGSEWEQTVEGVTIICVADDIQDCIKMLNGHWEPSDRGRDDNGVPEDTWWVIVVGDVKVYCDANAAESCPTLKTRGSKWEELPVGEPDYPETPASKWQQNIGEATIICVADHIEDCEELLYGHWVPSERYTDDNGVPEDTSWVIVVGNVKVYCDATDVESCPKLNKGGGEWGEEPDESDQQDEPENMESGSEWEQKVKGVTIICVADDIQYCIKMLNGHWEPSDRGRDDNGVPEDTSWVIVVGDVKVYCDAKAAESCPTLKRGGSKWEELSVGEPDYPQTPASKWQQNIGEATIICVADHIEDCKEVRYGHWLPSERYADENGVPQDTSWVIVVGNVKVYCDAADVDSCPTLKKGGSKWEELSMGEPDYSETLTTEWQQNVDGVTIICVADHIDDCKEVHHGHWVPSERYTDENGVPEDTSWVIVVGNVKVYCDATDAESCPMLNNGESEWRKESEESDDPDDPENMKGGSEWEQNINKVTIICVADDIEGCNKVLNGHWKLSERGRDDNGVPEDTWWVIVAGDVKVYCDAKEAGSCPHLKKGGRKWKGVSVGELDYPETPSSEWQQNVGEVTIICIADHDDCEEVHNGYWKPSDRGRDDNGVPEDTTWFIVIGNVKVYCDAKAAESCPKLKKGRMKWKQVSVDEPDESDDPDESEKKNLGSKWQQKVEGVTIICVANSIKDCKKIRNGHWKPSDRKKDENGDPKDVLWVIGTGDVRAYCDAENINKCPKIKDGRLWDPLKSKPNRYSSRKHRREVDVALITPELTEGERFRQPQGDDTVILCYGENADNCPVGGKWMKTNEEEVGEKVNNIITGRNVWVKKIGNRHVVCVAEDLTDCNPGDEGWIIIGGMKASLWVTMNHDIPLYCEAAEKSNCPDGVGDWVLISQDQWSQKILELEKKEEMWRLVTFKSTVYCDAKYARKCPKIKGYKWHKIFSNGIDFSSYGKKVNFEKKVGKTYYFCKAKKEVACPELPHEESWMKVKVKLTLKVILKHFEDVVGFKGACNSGICRLRKEGDVFNEDGFVRRRRRRPTKKKRPITTEIAKLEAIESTKKVEGG